MKRFRKKKIDSYTCQYSCAYIHLNTWACCDAYVLQWRCVCRSFLVQTKKFAYLTLTFNKFVYKKSSFLFTIFIKMDTLNTSAIYTLIFHVYRIHIAYTLPPTPKTFSSFWIAVWMTISLEKGKTYSYFSRCDKVYC